VSSRINWAPYFQYICEQNMKGEAIATDWTGTIATGSVVLTDVNTAVAAAGTVEELAKITEELKNGTRHVFNTANFTVGGSALTSYKADVDTDAAFEKDTEVIENGVFFESKFRSAPYFDLQIDGIKLLNTNFG
jgi:basic membrane protein A